MKFNASKYSNYITLFYCISFFLVINGGLFSFLTKGTPFTIWRQILTFIGFSLLMCSFGRYKNRSLIKIEKDLLLLTFLCIPYCIYAFFFQGYSLIRVGFALWMYTAGFHVVLFSSYLLNSSKYNPRSIFKFFSLLGLFLSIGLIIDSQTLLFKFLVLSAHEDISYLAEEDLAMNRCSFLAESVSTFGVYFSFCVLSSFYLLYHSSKTKSQFFYLLCSFLPLIGSWFTGSRQIFVIVLFMFFAGFVYYVICAKGNRVILLVIFSIILIASGSVITSLLSSNKFLLERYLGDDKSTGKADDTRIRQWKNGIDYLQENKLVLLIGHGVGSVPIKGVREGEFIGSNYENTFLAKMVDVGLFGIVLVLFPVIQIFSSLRKYKKKSIFDYLILVLLFNYLFVALISPNGATLSTQYIMFLVLSIYIHREKFELENKYASC